MLLLTRKPCAGVVGNLIGRFGRHRPTRRHRVASIPRLLRVFLHLDAGAMPVPDASCIGWAQSPVRIIVGFAPGSSPDILARLIARSMSERLGHEFVVDNRPGVGGNLAPEAVVNAQPDGRTLLLVGPSSAIDATLYE